MANAASGSLGYHPEDYGYEELEDIEASLDGGEDSGEGDEAFEDYEATDTETSDEGDEAFAAAREDEGFGEGDGEDVSESEPEDSEAVFTGNYWSERRARDAQLRADARARAAQSLDRSASRFATDVQRKLDQQLQRIPEPPPVRLDRLGTLRGSGVFTAKLPNGRTTAMMLTPTPARQADVNRLNQQISINHARQVKAIRMQGMTLAKLKAAQSSANSLHRSELLKISKDLNKRITDGDTNLDKRIAKEVDAQRKLVVKRDGQFVREMGQRQKRATWNTVLVASAVPLFAAYGDRAFGDNGNLLTKKNAILTGSLLGWLYADDLVNQAYARDSKTWRGAMNWWSYLAPIGNFATVYFFMRKQQHERFVTGISEVDAAGPKTVDLSNRIGPDYLKEFQGFKGVNVVATVQNGAATGVTAVVTDGKLTLTTVPPNALGTVSWSVDTLNPSNQRTTAN